jgi:hypothetical protein
VRSLTGEDRAEVLTVEGTRVLHADGRAWDVNVVPAASHPPRPESCGAALGTPARMDVRDIQEVVSPPS